MLSHHMVIRGGKIANYHPYPPTPWNASVRDSFGTPGPYEDAVQNTPIFEENPPGSLKGIDIMRAVRSFDPCLPCGVHMYLGNGKMLDKVHSPMTVTLSSTGPWTGPGNRVGPAPQPGRAAAGRPDDDGRRTGRRRWRMSGVRDVGARVEELLATLRSGHAADPGAVAEELVGLLVGFYGEGLEHIVAALREQGPAGVALL